MKNIKKYYEVCYDKNEVKMDIIKMLYEYFKKKKVKNESNDCYLCIWKHDCKTGNEELKLNNSKKIESKGKWCENFQLDN